MATKVCVKTQWVEGMPFGVPCKYKKVCPKYTEPEKDYPSVKFYKFNKMETCKRFKKYRESEE